MWLDIKICILPAFLSGKRFVIWFFNKNTFSYKIIICWISEIRSVCFGFWKSMKFFFFATKFQNIIFHQWFCAKIHTQKMLGRDFLGCQNLDLGHHKYFGDFERNFINNILYLDDLVWKKWIIFKKAKTNILYFINLWYNIIKGKLILSINYINNIVPDKNAGS